ncbi:MAG: hypothetical protein ACRCTY_09795, partial [Candidatus Adiutrix sp.]
PMAACLWARVNLTDDSAESESVLVGGVSFKSALLRDKLSVLTEAFPYVATEGRELSEWGHSLSGMERLFANGIQNVAMKMAESQLNDYICEKYGCEQVSSMNPGSLAVWPISQQKNLFQLLGPLAEQVGVELKPSLMMEPSQTVSGIFFKTDTKFHNCQLCLKEDCPSRKAPFTGVA